MTIKTKAPRQITIRELMRKIRVLKIDKNAIILIPSEKSNQTVITHLKYYREGNEVTLW